MFIWKLLCLDLGLFGTLFYMQYFCNCFLNIGFFRGPDMAFSVLLLKTDLVIPGHYVSTCRFLCAYSHYLQSSCYCFCQNWFLNAILTYHVIKRNAFSENKTYPCNWYFKAPALYVIKLSFIDRAMIDKWIVIRI